MRFDRRLCRTVIAVSMLAILTLSGCNLSPEAKEASFLEKGRKEVAKQNYAAAILYFKNASAAKPWDAEPYYRLGLAYLAGGDFKSAAAEILKAVEVNPRHTGAQLRLAEMMATSRDKKDLEAAQKHAQAVLALLPDDPDALNVLGVTDLRLGKPESAQPYLEQALRKTPTHLNSWVVLSQVKLARNDVAGAEKALLEAYTRLPKSPAPGIYLGEFYLAQGRAPEAEREFRKALVMDPRQGTALMDLAAMQVKAGQTDQAEQTYRQAAALPDKQYRPVHAEFLFRSGKRDLAVAEFEKLVAANPEDSELREKLVEAYLTLNRPGDAERVLTAAIRKNGLDQDALMRRSRIYLNAGKYTQA